MAAADTGGLAAEVGKMSKVIWGNGDPEKGLIVKVQRNEDALALTNKAIEQTNEKLDEIRKFLSRAFWAMVSCVGLACGTIIAAEFLAHWK